MLFYFDVGLKLVRGFCEKFQIYATCIMRPFMFNLYVYMLYQWCGAVKITIPGAPLRSDKNIKTPPSFSTDGSLPF